jgi:Flp pilus assembly protein TadD
MFGAWHSQKDSSLLHLPPGSSFDSNARQAIRLTRLAVLGSGPGGLGHETVDRLAALYSSTGADPGSNPLFQAYMFLGQELSNVERAEQAIEPLSRAVALSPADANAHYMLGKTDLAMQRFQDAAFEFRKVLDLNPRHASAWNNLGGTLVRQEHYEEAVAAFRKALEIEPANPMIRCNLAVALVHVPGHLDQGIAGIQDILRTNPDAPYAQQALKDALEFKQQEAAGHQTPGPGGSPAAKPDPAAAR